jgi:hypothetical protein
MDPVDGDLVVGNEFAKLRVGVRQVGNGLRVQIEDIVTGIGAELDPLELLGIAWSSPEERERFVNPTTMSRWRD